MLLLLLQSAADLFAIEARQVVEVIPRVALRSLPHAPRGIEGLLSYRGSVVPVIDLSIWLGASPSRDALSTRIIVARWLRPTGEIRTIGLIAENVINLQNVDDSRKRMATTHLETARYLGAVYQLDRGLVQIIRIERLLDVGLEAALFGETEEPADS